MQADVRIVTSLPSTHLVAKQSVENQIPFHVSPTWIRARFLQQVKKGKLELRLRSFSLFHNRWLKKFMACSVFLEWMALDMIKKEKKAKIVYVV